MPNDVITLKALTYELNESLSGGRIEKIFQPETDEITLVVKKQRAQSTLVVSANPSHPRIHVTTQKKENSYTAPAFCMLLRKHLTGGKIESISIFNNDRIVKMTVTSTTELKDTKTFYLLAELMGRYSNVILCDDEMVIVDAIRRIHFDQSTTRYILPHLKYVMQPQTRITLDRSEEILALLSGNDVSEKTLIESVSGVSKETAKEIALSPDPAEKFIELTNVNVRDTYSPCLRYENGVLKDFYVMPYATVRGEYQRFQTLNEAVNAFYLLYDGTERKKASAKQVTTILKRLQEKTERRIGDNEKRLAEAEKKEEFRKWGELILSYVYLVKPRDDTLVCYDYYDEREISIPLDPLASPAQNAQNYFKKYAKMKRAEEIATEQLAILNEQKEYLATIAVSIDNCALKSEMDEILAELNSLSGFRNGKRRTYTKEKPSKPTKLKIEGFDVYLGKNNLQNNEVTFRIADSGDTWLHVKASHGAHVIVKGVPTEKCIEKCARIAAYYSGARASEKVEVDYTVRKNVKRIPSAMLGMVTYTHYRTVLVSPCDYPDLVD